MGLNKFGWDLPPGCKSSDIPGNRPEDIAHEKLLEEVESALRPLPDDFPAFEHITNKVLALVNKAFEQGYAQCQNDVDEARSYAALEHVDDARLDDMTGAEVDKAMDDPNTRGEEHAP